jgi:hypothetical protein
LDAWWAVRKRTEGRGAKGGRVREEGMLSTCSDAIKKTKEKVTKRENSCGEVINLHTQTHTQT